MPPAKHQVGSRNAGADSPRSPGRGSRIEIQVANETDVVVDEARLIAAVEMVLAEAGCTHADVSLAIVDDPTIHRVNRDYLEHDYPTDVLSFVLNPPPRLEGQIVASIDTAAREAAELGWQPADELLLYIVHGTLHLVGHNDHEPIEAAAMRAAERRVLESLGVSVSPRDGRWASAAAASPVQEPSDQ